MVNKTLYKNIEKYKNYKKNQKDKPEHFLQSFKVPDMKISDKSKINNDNSFLVFSKDKKYRYYAYFELVSAKTQNKILTFILFNPSMSDENKLDPTTKNCIKIAKKEGYSAIEIINLYPFRSTKVIREIFNENNKEANEFNQELLINILANAGEYRHFVLAWGTSENKEEKAEEIITLVLENMEGKTVKKISINKKGIDKVNAQNNYIHPGSSLNIFGGVDSTELTDINIR